MSYDELDVFVQHPDAYVKRLQKQSCVKHYAQLAQKYSEDYLYTSKSHMLLLVLTWKTAGCV